MPKVMIHPATYENVRKAVDQAFALFPLTLRNRKVFIKPNVLRESEPAQAIVTNPAVLRAVVEKVETMNPASITVGDNPGVFCYGANEETFRTTGLMEAAKGYYQNIGNDAREVDFNPSFAPKVSLSRIVFEADITISLPKFKTHGLTVITGAIKNSYGFLPGAQKANMHMTAGSAERFHEMIVDLFEIRVPDLFIMDAVVGMEGNGPASPDLRDIGLVLASDNAVALDATVARIMGIENPGQLKFLRRAKEKGLGDYASEAIEIIGELKPLPAFKLPPASGEIVTKNESMQTLLRARTSLRPTADLKLCTGCGTCSDQCPASALSIRDGVPQVDAYKCIACFCCQEICPERAITLK
ncbi:MAG TPA: DUF362 domain-containing protein [Syntrophorhabdaceae bacterium]|nr:DUF362 domain-containing protein [Syntrophorhabdaceae bacterium]